MELPIRSLDDVRSTTRLVVSLLFVIMLGHFPVEGITEFLLPEDVPFWEEFFFEAIVLATITGYLAWVTIVRPLRSAAADEHRGRQAREAELRGEAERQRFDATVHRALEMVETEAETLTVLQRAVAERVPGRSATLLLADSSDSHLTEAVQVAGGDVGPRCCTVEEPRRCPAIRHSRAQHFADSRAIDACPHLRSDEHVSAVCVPMNAAGRAVGVLHSPAPPSHEADQTTIVDLERLVVQTGARLGLLRVVERTTLQAATDPLTGLMNRRVVEERAADLLRRHGALAVAVADLDNFKVLNDTYGHETGDRALRLFATTLAQSVRQVDLTSRYGGEEFLLVFPDLSASAAADVLRRCQEELLVRLGATNVPGFTASYGVADTSQSTDLATLVSLADAAMFRAKRSGRDGIVVASEVAAQTGAGDLSDEDVQRSAAASQA